MKIHPILKATVLFLLPLFTSSLYSQVFIENKGQVLDFYENHHPEVSYYYADHAAAVYLQNDRLVYNFKQSEQLDLARFQNDREGYEEALRNQQAVYHRLDMVFQHAQANSVISTGKQSQGVTHYYLNKRNGIRDVRSFESVKYENIYPNIDVVFYHTPNGLKYDLVLKAGANIQDIHLKFEGAKVSIENKKLIVSVNNREITEEIPLSFIDGDQARAVEVEYILHKDGTVGFRLKDQVTYTTLTIDPVLEWGSYFNLASGTDQLYGIANHLDNDGNYFTYGMAQNAASTYPVVNPGGAYTTAANGSADGYFAKFNANRQLVWSTYLGGSGYDEIYDGEIITSRGTTLHLVGERITTGAPFTNGGGFFQNTAARNFWARFNKNTGVLEHLTSLSSGYKPSISISNSGLVAIANDAYDFNTLPILNRAGAYNQGINGGTKDMGLLLFNASYTQIWGTFMGGTGSQENFMCAFDSNDNIYFVGETSNNAGLVNLPGAYNQSTVGGGTDVMLGKFTNTGQLVWSTLYGGNGSDARRGQQGHGARILVHPTTNELILAFNTTSNNLPVTNLPGAYNKTAPTHIDFGGSSGSFWNYAAHLCKFSTAGALNYSTYYYSETGGGDLIENIAFGGCNKFYIGSAGEATKQLTGAGSGYNLTQGTGAGRSGYITMLSSSTFAFEWDSYINPNISSEANVAANINQAPFYTATTLYYNNLPVVDPGNGAYYNGTSSNPSGAGVGISQFHPSLPPDVTDVSLCSGASVGLTASGGMGAPYNWYSSQSSPTVLHTGATYNVSPTTTTTYYVSSGTGMCASPRVPVTANVTTVTTGTASINPTSACSGSSATLTLAGHSGTIQWEASTNGGANWTTISGATTTPYVVNNITTSTSYRAVVTNGSCTGNSNTVSITITPTVIPNVMISGAPGSAICSGTSVTFTANPTNGGAAPTYQWQINGGDVSGATNSTFTTSSLNNGDVVTVIMTSNAPCASPATASASTSAISVITTVTPGVTISGTPGAAICSGTSVTFTANPTNGGTTPTYQWQVNGGNVPGATNSTFTTSSLNNGDVVTVIMTSNATCASPATASASTSTITVTPTVTPGVTISGAPGAAICSGTSVTFTANPTNGGTTPTYQWQVNGGNIAGATNNTFTPTSINNGDVITVIMTSNAPCASPTTASASTSAISVITTVTPGVTISGTPGAAICSGTSVTFTANPTNGGTSPGYQWQINGGNVPGATNSTFTTSSLNNGDVVTVIMTSNAPCASPASGSASTTAITVTPTVTPGVTISGTPGVAICSGTSVTFTANPTNGGTTPTYQWQVNGGNVPGATNSTFTTSSLNNGDVVTVIMTSNAPCASPASGSASTTAITVTTTVVPSVSITGDAVTGLCAGSTVNLTANPTNGGTTPTYQWQINGSNVSGATNSTFSTSGLNNGDVITVIMTSSSPCASPATASDDTPAAVIVANVTPSVTITGTPSAMICSGTSVTFTANPTNGGTTPTYQWQVNGADMPGATGSTYTTSTLNNGDVVSVVLTSDDPCASPLTATATTGVGTIQVGDDQDPVISNCPANITVSSVGSCTATVTWTAPTATDNCSTPSLTASHNPGDIFPAGTTVVTYTATDAAGNVATCTFNVTVEDDIDPVIVDCQGDTTLQITAANCETTLPDYTGLVTATDNCTGTITYTQSPAAGTTVSTTDGSITVTITAEDASGNQATCSFEVTIVDNVPQSNAGSPISSVQLCSSTGSIDLVTLLPNDADPGGSWIVSSSGLNPGNALNGTVLTVENLPAGSYIFDYVVGICKSDTLEVIINVFTDYNVDPGEENPGTAFCPKNISQIDLNTFLANPHPNGVWSATGADSIYLNPNGNLNITNLENGAYTYVYTISKGSCGSTSVTVTIIINCKEFDIPNYVTANGDGVDDVFVIQGIENFPDNELTIYNRWGNVVYHTTNYQNDWDGRSTSKLNVGGDELPTGTYYYVLDTQSELHGVKTGFIYLKR